MHGRRARVGDVPVPFVRLALGIATSLIVVFSCPCSFPGSVRLWSGNGLAGAGDGPAVCFWFAERPLRLIRLELGMGPKLVAFVFCLPLCLRSHCLFLLLLLLLLLEFLFPPHLFSCWRFFRLRSGIDLGSSSGSSCAWAPSARSSYTCDCASALLHVFFQ